MCTLLQHAGIPGQPVTSQLCGPAPTSPGALSLTASHTPLSLNQSRLSLRLLVSEAVYFILTHVLSYSSFSYFKWLVAL